MARLKFEQDVLLNSRQSINDKILNVLPWQTYMKRQRLLYSTHNHSWPEVRYNNYKF